MLRVLNSATDRDRARREKKRGKALARAWSYSESSSPLGALGFLFGITARGLQELAIASVCVRRIILIRCIYTG